MQLLHSNSSRVHPGPELEDDDSNSIESLCNIPGRFVNFCNVNKSEFLALSKRPSSYSVFERSDWCTATALAVSNVAITVTVIFFVFSAVITAVLIVNDMGCVNIFGALSFTWYHRVRLDSLQSLIFSSLAGEDMRRTLHFKGEILQNNDTEGSSEDALDDVDQNATAALLRELMQYYGQGDEAIDEACRAALASVSSQEVNSARDCDGNSLLITCCQLGGEGVSDLIERLLNKGADPRVVNSAGASALHFASYHGDTITTELLLKYGGDPMEVEYIHGCTPLHYAASVGNMEVCEALILVGADIFAEDHHAYTASRYADDAGHTKLQDLLNKEGFLANEKKQERGIWRRHVDEATGAAYRYNSTTGECFWDEEVTTLAKERKTEEKQIPEAIQSWINQEKYRVSLTNLLARVDPRRIIEIDEIVEMAGNVSNLTGIIQSLKEEYKFDENKDTTHGDDEPHIDIARGEDDTIEGYMSMGNTKEQAGNEMNNKPDEELQAFEFQITEAEAKERDQRQEIEVLNKNLEAIRSKTKNAAIEVEGLQEHLNKIRAGSGEGGGERPQLESELDILKTSIQTETGTLEELKNALEIKQSEDAGRKSEMYATHKLDAEARQNRSRKMESDSAEEMARIEIEHSERMRSANLQYEIDLEEMNKEFYNRISVLKREKLEFEKESEKEILSITSAQDKLAASDDKQVAEKSKAYLLEMKEKIQHAHEAVRAYRAALATLIREADYSAALHNQLVDMKGSSRLMVKLKPSSNSAAAFVKDGSATVARVDKKPLVSFKVDAVTSEQSDLYTHIQPLAVSVTDGRTVALVVFSTRGSGKTYSLFGDGKTDSMFRKPGVSEQESICKTPDSPGSPRKTRRTKDDESDLIPVAGVIPRFLQTLFSTIEEREVRECIGSATYHRINNIHPILPF